MPDWGNEVISGDWFMELLLAREGRFFYMDDVMSIYRQEGQGISSVMNAQKIKMFNGLIFILSRMKEWYGGLSADAFDRSIANYEQLKKMQEKENFYLEHPVLRALRPKTYKRAIKKWLAKKINV